MGCSSGPDIIQDGLVLCLDAASKRSYDGSSTEWVDLKGGNNGTFENNPTFETDNNGIIKFDGTDDYIDLSDYVDNICFSKPATISLWFKPLHGKLYDTSFLFYAQGDGYRDTNADYFYISYGLGSSTTPEESFNIACAQDGTRNDNTTNTMLKCINYGEDYQNRWVHVCLVIGGSFVLYLDGVAQTLSGSSFWTGTSIGEKYCDHFSEKTYAYIGRMHTASDNNSYLYGPFKIGNFSIYNRALSADEIRQNYLSTKERFA